MRDPAILLYKDKWLIATKGMRADAKGWYLNLIIYQHDIGSLPNDIEELANLCDVRFSEFEQFKQVFEQVLKHKFELTEDNRLENAFAREIIQNRETFKEKRSDAGKLSYVLKYFRKHFKYKAGFEDWFKQNVSIDFDIKNEQVLKQVFKQNFELYINVNEDVNRNIKFNFKSSILDLGVGSSVLDDWLKVRKLKKCANTETAFNAIKKEIDKTGLTANECILKAVEKSWGGFEAEWLKKTINNTSNNASNRRDLSQIDHGTATKLADM